VALLRFCCAIFCASWHDERYANDRVAVLMDCISMRKTCHGVFIEFRSSIPVIYEWKAVWFGSHMSRNDSDAARKAPLFDEWSLPAIQMAFKRKHWTG
jgi:hypothetical protein